MEWLWVTFAYNIWTYRGLDDKTMMYIMKYQYNVVKNSTIIL